MSDRSTRYACIGIAALAIGRFQFEKGILVLEGDDAAEFAKLLPTLPLQEQARIQKIDVDAAIELLEAQRTTQGGATKTTDSSVGERGSDVSKLGAKLGTGDLSDSNPKGGELAPLVAKVDESELGFVAGTGTDGNVKKAIIDDGSAKDKPAIAPAVSLPGLTKK